MDQDVIWYGLASVQRVSRMSVLDKRMDQDSNCYVGRPRPRRDCVRWGPAPPPKKGAQQLPHFSAHANCGQTTGWIRIPLDTEVGLRPGHIVLDGDPTPHGMGHSSPHFSAHVYCGQTTGWIRIPLDTEVGLGPGDIVLDGHPAPPPRKGAQQPPLFGPCLCGQMVAHLSCC